jgi:hypothetical protein
MAGLTLPVNQPAQPPHQPGKQNANGDGNLEIAPISLARSFPHAGEQIIKIFSLFTHADSD